MATKKKTTTKKDEAPPRRGDKGWTDYVLSHVDRKDLKEGNPTVDGLYKACLRTFGDIIKFDVNPLTCPTERDRSTTIKADVVCVAHETGIRYEFSDITDSFVHRDGTFSNVKTPFDMHLTSTTSSKALGKALRRLLCFNQITHEEFGDTENSTLRATSVQKTAIENTCTSLGIDFAKLLAAKAGLAIDQIETLSSEAATSLLNLLNSFKDESEEIPKEIKKNE